MAALVAFSSDDQDGDDPLFRQIADELSHRNYCVIPNALPAALAAGLHADILDFEAAQFTPAGVGRDDNHTLNSFVRRDAIRWINGQSQAERDWLYWTAALQTYLNRRLFMGLSLFESHFAHYRPGDFYRRHLDAFKAERLGQDTPLAKSNRVLSLVAYFNPGWLPDDGGELVLYASEQEDAPLLRVTPGFGSLVVFLSEEVPHEVLSARRDRYSIAGWYRC